MSPKNDPNTLTIRRYQPGDEVEIVKTFNLVFREVCGEGYVDRTVEQWRWQFLDNPMGHRISLAVAPDGTVVSQYTGMPQMADTPYGEQVFVHCLDSFTHPDWRKGLKRPGIFVITGRPFSARSREIGDALLYGYPVQIAERIGTKFLEYNYMRTVDFLVAPVDAASPAAAGDVEVDVGSSVPHGVDDLYRQVKADKQCLLRRDHRYLDWRYARHPADHYRILTARRDGALCGLAVVRPTSGLVPDSGTLADWVVPTDDEAARAALLTAARRVAGEAGSTSLLAVFPQWSPEWQQLPQHGFEVAPSSNWMERRLIGLVTAPEQIAKDFTYDWLVENWWYTLGDSDLV